MQDRLGELRSLAQHKNRNAAEKMRQGASVALQLRDQMDIEAQLCLMEPDRTNFMEDFFKKTEEVKLNINKILELVDKVRKDKKQAKKATSQEEEKAASKKLDGSLNEIKGLVLSTKKLLEDLKTENREFSGKNQNNSEARIRDNLHGALTRKFREVLVEFQTLQTDYKQDVKDKMARQINIVCPEATDAEREEIMEDGQVADIIRAKISGQTAHSSVQNALADIQDKYNDIRRLEKNVTELHQLFVDLATLVDAQGELLDQIEFSVNSAKDYTEKAEKEFVTARKHQKTAQKRMCCISVCLIILAVVVMIPLVVVFTK